MYVRANQLGCIIDVSCSASVLFKMPHTCAGCGDASASVVARRMGVVGLPGCDICGLGFCGGCLRSDINPCLFEPVRQCCYGCIVATKASIVRRYDSSPSGSGNSSSGTGSSSSGDTYVAASTGFCFATFFKLYCLCRLCLRFKVRRDGPRAVEKYGLRSGIAYARHAETMVNCQGYVSRRFCLLYMFFRC